MAMAVEARLTPSHRRQMRVCSIVGAALLGMGFLLRTVILESPVSVFDMLFSPLALPVAFFFPGNDIAFGLGVGVVEVLVGFIVGKLIGRMVKAEDLVLAVGLTALVCLVPQLMASGPFF